MSTPTEVTSEARTPPRKALLLVQSLVSVSLIVLLLYLAQGIAFRDLWQNLTPLAFLLATALMLLVSFVNARRWQLLLANLGVQEPLPRLTGLYLIGQFCSMFLPGSASGDVVRIFQVSRRGWSPWRVVMATLQERLIGLGMTMFAGLIATLWCFSLLPSSLRLPILLLQLTGASCVLALLYPSVILTYCFQALHSRNLPPMVLRVLKQLIRPRLRDLLHRLYQLPSLPPLAALHVLSWAFISFILNTAVYVSLGSALGITTSWLSYCLVIPLVWVVRLLPISLNGIGVGEGAFVYLIGLFGVATDQALLLALTVLAIQSLVSLFGGLLLLAGFIRTAKSSSQETTSQLLEFPPLESKDQGEQRHAA